MISLIVIACGMIISASPTAGGTRFLQLVKPSIADTVLAERQSTSAA